jgi:hypothetical protein
MRAAAIRTVGIVARLAIAALWLTCAPATPAPPAAEHQVKAVYLFNFAQFVEWPKQSFESPEAPFVIGILGKDAVGGTLEEVVRGESLNGRRFEVRQFAEPDKVGPCHVLFIGRDMAAGLEQALATLRGRSVLTVTDIEGAEQLGAVITLFKDSKRIRMRINVAAARANELVISSKLLRPAEIVGGGTL